MQVDTSMPSLKFREECKRILNFSRLMIVLYSQLLNPRDILKVKSDDLAVAKLLKFLPELMLKSQPIVNYYRQQKKKSFKF